MSLNVMKIAFLSKAFITGFFGLLTNLFEDYLPASISKIYRHGKFCSNLKDVYLDKIEVPKRWFKHFYVFAAPLSTIALALLYYRFYTSNTLPKFIIELLHFCLGKPVQSLIPVENTLLAMIIFTIHCWKRFYEAHYVNVFSDNYMNISLYIIGFFHYFGTVTCILGETSDIVKDVKINVQWSNLSLLDYVCSAIFLILTYWQYRTNIILSSLRKDKTGVVVSKEYKVPHGELFNYVTAPLQFTEIVMYLCLSIILRHASTFHYITLWVVVNQMECAYLSHQWALRKFENYPKSRKIIIPFVF